VALNEKFIKARRDYEALLESSMSQTAAAHYGRPPAATNPYTYPPSDGFPEPSRYYTPGPQQSASPQNVQGAYPPPQQKPAYGGGRQSSNQYYPQQSNDEHHQPGPTSGAPFYVVGQMPPSAQHGKAPSASPAQPHHQQHQPPSNAPPASAVGAGVGNHQTDGPSQPQELATSIYDTPIEPKHESSFAGQPASPSHPPSSPYYQPYQHRPLSTHQPSYPADGPSPISPQNPYPQLQGSPSQTYQAYPPQQQHRPQNYYTPQHSQHEPPNTSSAPTPMPQDYYRQSELFLPNGSRAQG
jgi:signal transducing adaptor molecule